ncbi:MAG: hypothetical protein RLT05_22120, partial [Bauldia litoralis]
VRRAGDDRDLVLQAIHCFASYPARRRFISSKATAMMMSNGLGMLDLPTEWQLVITGIIIIIAVAFDEMKRRRAG